MITELKIVDHNKTCIDHFPKVEALKNINSLQFTPGLNIIIGPNGSGKSTILQLIAKMLHAEQGGISTVTQSSCREVMKSNPQSGSSFMDGAYPVHDGQPILYYNPYKKIVLDSGHFDDDFLTDGVLATKMRGSSGEDRMFQMKKILSNITNLHELEIVWKTHKSNGSNQSNWSMVTHEIEVFLQGTLEKGKPTILLEEPEQNLSMKYQINLWDNLATKVSKSQQIIATSHSPFALNLPDANYIELEPGYIKESETAVNEFCKKFINS